MYSIELNLLTHNDEMTEYDKKRVDEYKNQKLRIEQLRKIVDIYPIWKSIQSYLNDKEKYDFQCAIHAFEQNYTNNIKTLGQVQCALLFALFPATTLSNVELDGSFVRELFTTTYGHLTLSTMQLPEPAKDMIDVESPDDYQLIVKMAKDVCKNKFDSKPIVYVRIGTPAKLPFHLIKCVGLKCIKEIENYTIVIVDWDEFYSSIDVENRKLFSVYLDRITLRENFTIAFIFSTRHLRRTCCVWLNYASPVEDYFINKEDEILLQWYSKLPSWYLVCTPVYDRKIKKLSKLNTGECYTLTDEEVFYRYTHADEEVFCCDKHLIRWMSDLTCSPFITHNRNQIYMEQNHRNTNNEIFIKQWKRRMHVLLSDYYEFSPIGFPMGVCVYGRLVHNPQIIVTEKYYRLISMGNERQYLLPRQLFVL